MSSAGACAGAAVLFDSWEARRHKRPDRQQTQEEVQVQVLEGRPLVPEVLSGWRPSEGQVAELQESVRAQADAIREMKTAQGLKNQVRACGGGGRGTCVLAADCQTSVASNLGVAILRGVKEKRGQGALVAPWVASYSQRNARHGAGLVCMRRDCGCTARSCARSAVLFPGTPGRTFCTPPQSAAGTVLV